MQPMFLPRVASHRPPCAATPQQAGWLLRALLGLLVCCVVLQATAVSAYRALGRAHHHVAVGAGAASDAGHGHSHEHGPGQSVASLHDHPMTDSTVVYVKGHDDHAAPGHGPATKRTVLDLDSLTPLLPAAPSLSSPGRWPAADPAPARSYLTAPLERPPRA